MPNADPKKTDSRPSSTTRVFIRHPWWTGLALLAILGLLFVFLVLPPGIRWGIEKWLESHGRLQAHVEEVDFNLFSGYLVVHSLVTEGRDEGGMQWGRLSLEIEWRPIFRKRIRLDDLSLARARIDIVQEKNGAVYLGGLRIREDDSRRSSASREQKNKGWEIGFGTIDLEDVRLRLTTAADETRELTIQRAHLDAFASWNPSQPSRFEAVITVDAGRLEVQGTASPLAPTARYDLSLRAQDFPLGWTAPFSRSEVLNSIQGSLAADTDLNVSVRPDAARSVHIQQEGRVSLDRLTLELPRARVGPTGLNWDGSLELSFDSDAEAAATADGVLGVAGATLRLDRMDVSAEVDSIRIDGAFSRDGQPSGGTRRAAFQGEVAVKGLRLDDARSGARLAQARQLTIQGIDLSDRRISVDGLQLIDTDLLERPETDLEDRSYGLSLSAVHLDSIQADLKDNGLRVESVSARDVRASLNIDPKGRLKIIDRIPSDRLSDPKPGQEKPGSKWTVQIDRAALEKGAEIVFHDYRTAPPVDLSLSNIQASARSIDSKNPDQPVSIEVQADVGKHARFAANGSVTPFAESIDMDVNGEIKQFSLPEIRGYAERFWGYTIRSGQLYADFHLRVEKDRMDSQVKLFIARLDLNRQREEALHELTRQLGMPLDSALDLIRDSDHNIRLNLPITGSLTQPEVGLGGVIGKAIKNAAYQAIKTAALTYFAPLGAAYAATKIFGHATALRLDPVFFEPGQSDIIPESRTYLDQVAQRLGDRPEARLLLCGKTVPQDRKAWGQDGAIPGERSASETGEAQVQDPTPVADARLLELAESRAEAVHAYLSSRGIDAGRLVMCAPEIETEDHRPQVELAL